MKYTVTIKDNTTDEIILNDQTDCIIGVINLKDSTKKISFSAANTLNVIDCAIKTVEMAEHVINRITSHIEEGNNG